MEPETSEDSVQQPSKRLQSRRSIHESTIGKNMTQDLRTLLNKTEFESAFLGDPRLCSDGESSASLTDKDEDSDEDDVISDISREQTPYTDADERDKKEQRWIPEGAILNLNEKLCANTSQSNENFKYAPWIILISVISVASVWAHVSTGNDTLIQIEEIKSNFLTQEDELWTSLESGIKDISEFNRPSTFILLYENEAQDTIDKFLEQISKYATRNITHSQQNPIEITDQELNSPEVVRDYGIIIEKYRDKLKEKGVMIVKNLHNVKGISAQAFHTLCDEYTPLVEKSLIIFTMKVDKLPHAKKRLNFVEENLRKKWNDIKADTFNALLTRITSMVLEIRAN